MLQARCGRGLLEPGEAQNAVLPVFTVFTSPCYEICQWCDLDNDPDLVKNTCLGQELDKVEQHEAGAR